MVAGHRRPIHPYVRRKRRRRVAADPQRDRTAGAKLVTLVNGRAIVCGGELERRRRRHSVDRGVEMSGANRAHQHRAVGGRVARQRTLRADVNRQHAKRGLVTGERERQPAVAGVGAARRQLGVRIDAGNADDPAPPHQRGPLLHRPARLNQARHHFGRTKRVVDQRERQAAARTPLRVREIRLRRPHPPRGVWVQELETIEWRVPVAPRKLRLRRIRMRGDAKSPKSPDVFDHVARLAGEGKRRRRHVERHVVTAAGADFDAVETEHAGTVLR